MTNQQLIDYIKQAQGQNQTREQITQALLDAGWQSGDIDEAFEVTSEELADTSTPEPALQSAQSIQSPKNQQTQQPARKSHKGLFIILAFIIGVIIIGGGIFVYFYTTQDTDIQSNTDINSIDLSRVKEITEGFEKEYGYKLTEKEAIAFIQINEELEKYTDCLVSDDRESCRYLRDARRFTDLNDIALELASYTAYNKSLPVSLVELTEKPTELSRSTKLPIDPKTGASYQYQLYESDFQLCAQLESIATKAEIKAKGDWNGAAVKMNEGRACFQKDNYLGFFDDVFVN